MKRIAIFASGSGSNAQRIIEYFQSSNSVEVSLILSNKANAFVLERAKKFGIKSAIFNKTEFYEKRIVLDQLTVNNIDFIVLAGFLLLFPSNIITCYPNKIVNIHPSLLPKFGGKGMYGMHVHKSVIKAKELETGITIHYVDEKYDEGNIIFQKKCDVLPEDSPESIAKKISMLEHKYFPKVIEDII